MSNSNSAKKSPITNSDIKTREYYEKNTFQWECPLDTTYGCIRNRLGEYYGIPPHFIEIWTPKINLHAHMIPSRMLGLHDMLTRRMDRQIELAIALSIQEMQQTTITDGSDTDAEIQVPSLLPSIAEAQIASLAVENGQITDDTTVVDATEDENDIQMTVNEDIMDDSFISDIPKTEQIINDFVHENKDDEKSITLVNTTGNSDVIIADDGNSETRMNSSTDVQSSVVVNDYPIDDDLSVYDSSFMMALSAEEQMAMAIQLSLQDITAVIDDDNKMESTENRSTNEEENKDENQTIENDLKTDIPNSDANEDTIDDEIHAQSIQISMEENADGNTDEVIAEELPVPSSIVPYAVPSYTEADAQIAALLASTALTTDVIPVNETTTTFDEKDRWDYGRQNRGSWEDSISIKAQTHLYKDCLPIQFQIVSYDVHQFDKMLVWKDMKTQLNHNLEHKQDMNVNLTEIDAIFKEYADVNNWALFNIGIYAPAQGGIQFNVSRHTITIVHNRTWTAKEFIENILNTLKTNPISRWKVLDDILHYLKSNGSLDENDSKMDFGDMLDNDLSILQSLKAEDFCVWEIDSGHKPRIKYMYDVFECPKHYECTKYTDFRLQLLSENDPLRMRMRRVLNIPKKYCMLGGGSHESEHEENIAIVVRIKQRNGNQNIGQPMRIIIDKCKTFRSLILEDLLQNIEQIVGYNDGMQNESRNLGKNEWLIMRCLELCDFIVCEDGSTNEIPMGDYLDVNLYEFIFGILCPKEFLYLHLSCEYRY